MKTTFIYGLKNLGRQDIVSTKIRYVGKADDPYRRLDEHCRTKKKDHRGCWIRSLLSKGSSPQLEILDEVPESEWQFWEKEYIRVFRAIGFNLVNETDGGEGVSGRKLTSEHRKKIGMAMRGHKNPFFGKKHTPESGKKMGVSRSGSKNPFFGKKHSFNTVKKMREAALLREEERRQSRAEEV